MDAGLRSSRDKQYTRAPVVTFTSGTVSGCGPASSQTGPFYCPADHKVYLDLSFFQELSRRFGAPGDFAAAYVIAHEIGHHVQSELGVEEQVRRKQQEDPGNANVYLVRLELQADCFAGVWARSTYDRGLLESGDTEEGMQAPPRRSATTGSARGAASSGRTARPRSASSGSRPGSTRATRATATPATSQDLSAARMHHWIGGARVDGTSGRSGPVYNPATGRQTGAVDFASVEEVGETVAAAKAAFPEWRTTSLAKRAELFFAIRELVHTRRDEIARILTAEHGKVLSDAMGEVTRGLEVIEFACGIPTLLKGDFSEQASTGIDVYSIRQPLGVVAGITPFNFPAMVPMWMWAPAIACGNTFVLKPSEKDPSASLLTAELLKEAGLPDGVFNVVHGDKVAVDAILEHPDIAAVSFVGSTPIARYIYETGTKHGKRVQALGGAKNHMIVLPDADIDMAADAAVSAGYGSAGERCMAVSVLVAVGDVADPLVDAIKERLPKVKVGDGLEPDSEMGPLVTREHRDKVASYIDSGSEQGATLVADGRETAPGRRRLLPRRLAARQRHARDGRLPRRDLRAGALGRQAKTYDEALGLVNDNPYGNGVAIFTRDGGAARQFQFDVNAGMVGINVPIPVPVAYYSFGGWKASLFGDSHIYGPEGIHFYTRGKVVTSRWPDPATSKVDRYRAAKEAIARAQSAGDVVVMNEDDGAAAEIGAVVPGPAPRLLHGPQRSTTGAFARGASIVVRAGGVERELPRPDGLDRPRMQAVLAATAVAVAAGALPSGLGGLRLPELRATPVGRRGDVS